MVNLRVLLFVVVAVAAGCGANQPSGSISSRDTWIVLTRADCSSEGGAVAFATSDGRRALWSRSDNSIRWSQGGNSGVSALQVLPTGDGLTTATLARDGTAIVQSSTVDGIINHDVSIPASGYAGRLVGAQWYVVFSEPQNSAGQSDYTDYAPDSFFQADVWQRDGSRYKWRFTAEDAGAPLMILALVSTSANSCLLLCQGNAPRRNDISQYELRELDLFAHSYVRSEELDRKADTSPPFGLVLSSGGRLLGVLRRRAIDIYELPSFAFSKSIHCSDDLGDHDCVALSDDGRWLAVGTDSARVFASDTGAPAAIDAPNHKYFEILNNVEHQRNSAVAGDVYWQGALRSGLSVAHLQFVKGDTELIVVTHAGQVHVWDTTTWKLLSTKRLFRPSVIEQVFGDE